MTFEGATYLGEEAELSARYGFIATGASIDPYLERLAAADDPVDVVLDAPIADGGRFVYVVGVAHGTVVELIELSEELRLRMDDGGGH